MNNMSKIRIINIKDNGYKTIRLISKRFKVKYYDPPISDTIIEFYIQIKFPYMIFFNKFRTIKIYTYSKNTDNYCKVVNKAVNYFNKICKNG